MRDSDDLALVVTLEKVRGGPIMDVFQRFCWQDMRAYWMLGHIEQGIR